MTRRSVSIIVALALCGAAAFGCTTVRQLREHSTLPVNGHAEKTRTGDALDYSVAISIKAPPEVIWSILTDAPAYTTWNSTIVKLEGTIAQDQQIKLVSKDAPDRTFELKVSAFEAPKRMVWEDGGSTFLGVRNFTLIPGADGTTTFAMSETFSGGMLGMIEGSLPDFQKSFDAFAADLKKHAESKAGSGGQHG
jgi:uncharacterized protein YndB with AHSA1/START domain